MKVFAFVLLFLALFTSSAFAHVTVNPTTVNVGTSQTFTIAVPVEKEVGTTSVRIIIPEGVTSVTPNVKPGWTINVVKDSKDVAKVTEIDWTGGYVPAGQRDEFTFVAKVPGKEVALNWKAYQTSEDGSVTEWINKPTSSLDEKSPPPYSVTKVINDLGEKKEEVSSIPTSPNNLVLVLSIIAVAISLTTFFTTRKKTTK